MKYIGMILLILLTACGKERSTVIKKDAPKKVLSPSALQKNTDKENKKTKEVLKEKKIKNEAIKVGRQAENKKKVTDFLPKGFVISKTIYGDLNKDGLEDGILLIKATDKGKVVKDENLGELDRNRRGIIVLLKNGNHYDLTVNNHDCFSSENEDGGVYFAPELSVHIKKGKLFINYGHGRYGSWEYTFRHKNAGFELIGYDRWESSGPILDSNTSINFLTKKKLVRTNTNQNTKESGDEVFDEKWENINIGKLFKLSEIKDFDLISDKF